MRIFTYYIALAMWALAMFHCQAQESDLEAISNLKIEKSEIINEEKDALKAEVEAINRQLEDGDISPSEADRLKTEAAQKRALNIENRVAIIDNKIALIERNGIAKAEAEAKEKDKEEDDDDTDDTFFEVTVYTNPGHHRRYDRRTKSELVFSFGLNNAIFEGQSIDDSPYKIGGSKFTEIGWSWKTRVFKNSNWLRIKYGFSFTWNGLKPTDNRYFVDTGEQTELQVSEFDLDKAKLRLDNLVIPVHFELGPSRRIDRDHYFRYKDNRSFKIGLGGYAGLNLGTRQKLKYKDNGENVKEKIKGNYNTNNFIYGLSGYIGWGAYSLYCKYDLNTIFIDNPVDERNISLGLRFDWD
mgnify:CR=1 FL=1